MALFVNLWGWRQALARLTIVGLIWLLSILVFVTPQNIDQMITRVFLYSSWQGYGLQAALPHILNVGVFLVGLLLLARWTRRRRPLSAVLIGTCGFFVFAYGMGPNQFPILITISALMNPLAALLVALSALPILAHIVGWETTVKNAVWLSATLLLGLQLRFRH